MASALSRHAVGCQRRSVMTASRALSFDGEAGEFLLHGVDFREICRDVMIAAALAGHQMVAAARERLRRTCAAEMNYRGQLFLLLPADFRSSPICEDRRGVSVQEHRRKLGGVARHDSRIEPT